MNNVDVFNDMDHDISHKATEIVDFLKSQGINFTSGVPCGVLRDLIRCLTNDSEIMFVPATRESEVVGLAAGATFAGKKVVVFMQNSGLFLASNDIASLLLPYELPVYFLVTYRGCPDEDAIQHKYTGQATEALLKSLDIEYLIYNSKNGLNDVQYLYSRMVDTGLPVVLLLKRGWDK